MKQPFKSKIGPEIALLVGVPFACIFSVAYSDGRILQALGIMSPVILLLASMIYDTSYTIIGADLKIRAGIFRYGNIEISKIRKIQSSDSWVSAPALSMDRIEIFYSKYDSISISPKNKQGFIDALLNINPNIEVILTK